MLNGHAHGIKSRINHLDPIGLLLKGVCFCTIKPDQYYLYRILRQGFITQIKSLQCFLVFHYIFLKAHWINFVTVQILFSFHYRIYDLFIN